MAVTVKLAAPKGMFRVVCVDTFDGTDWLSGDFASLDQAKTSASFKGGEMLKAYVYDDQGNHLANFGSY